MWHSEYDYKTRWPKNFKPRDHGADEEGWDE